MKLEQQPLFPEEEKPKEATPLEELRLTYILARRDHEYADEKKKAAYKAYKKAEGQLVDAMAKAGVMSQKSDDGMTFSLKRFVDFRANEANSDEILEWLENNGEVRDDFVGKSIKKVRLREFLKGYIEERGLMEIPESMDVSERPNLSVRGWKQ
jgi:hypothetical protein